MTAAKTGGVQMFPKLEISLTLEQQFQMRLMGEQVGKLTKEQATDLLLQAYRLLMLKDNVIRSLGKKAG